MNSKRLLTLFLSLCMLVSVMSPAVFATTAPEDSHIHAEETVTEQNEKTPEISNDLIVSMDGEKKQISTMRDEDQLRPHIITPGTTKSNGTWTFTESDITPSTSLTKTETPACIAELEEASHYYDENEKVLAFVVLEDKPLAETYSDIHDVSPTAEDKLITQQNIVLNAIE